MKITPFFLLISPLLISSANAQIRADSISKCNDAIHSQSGVMETFLPIYVNDTGDYVVWNDGNITQWDEKNPSILKLEYQHGGTSSSNYTVQFGKDASGRLNSLVENSSTKDDSEHTHSSSKRQYSFDYKNGHCHLNHAEISAHGEFPNEDEVLYDRKACKSFAQFISENPYAEYCQAGKTLRMPSDVPAYVNGINLYPAGQNAIYAAQPPGGSIVYREFDTGKSKDCKGDNKNLLDQYSKLEASAGLWCDPYDSSNTDAVYNPAKYGEGISRPVTRTQKATP